MKRYLLIISILFLALFLPRISSASSLTLSPTSGDFSVGSTFDVSILLDTEGKSINALKILLNFPPDKLQVISPSTGKSIVGIWSSLPSFNNNQGTILLEGGIPGGITASSGVVTNITFRVKSPGQAILRFQDDTEVFLDDGLATEDLDNTQSGIYHFHLPPPQGPIVVSSTHPDQSKWYQRGDVALSFTGESAGVEGFSYVLNNSPIEEPDGISEGLKTSVAYTDLADGVYYFHIKALRDGIWGGTTHFALRVDATSPSDFDIEILPDSHTTVVNPLIRFLTTDQASGVSYYEIKLEPLSPEAVRAFGEGEAFFIEATSPYVTSTLTKGSYDVIVRAYDRAGNYKEVSERLSVSNFALSIIDGRGIRFGNFFVLPWFWVWVLALIPVGLLTYMARRVLHWRRKVHLAHGNKKLPDEIENKLRELKELQKKYGAKVVVILLIVFSAFLFGTSPVLAQTRQIAPPLIDSISRDISNKEIFYIGGKTNLSEQEVIIHFQNLTTGETLSYNVVSSLEGDWFYRHDKLIPAGEYLLWVQARDGENLSPPSPQERITVDKTAVQFGSNRLSYEIIYLAIIIIFALILLGLVLFIIFHFRRGHQKYRALKAEAREAEESIKRGFAVLRRDIEAELALVHQMKPGDDLGAEEKAKEKKLLEDLASIERHIGQEIWQIEQELDE